MDLQQPYLRSFAPHLRCEYARIFDLANTLRTDETVERVVDSWARRYQLQPSPGQKLMMAQPLGLAAQFRALFREDGGGKDSWFDADNVTSDGGTKLYSWNDRIDPTHLLFQGTSGAQCNLPVADASFANAKTATFNGSSTNYSSNRAPSAFIFLHDGSGAEVVPSFYIDTSGDTILWSTWTNNATGSVWCYIRTAGWVVRPVGGGGTAFTVTGSIPSFAATYAAYSLSLADSPNARGYNRSTQVAYTTSYPSGLYTTASTQPLCLGNIAPGQANTFQGRVRALYLFRRLMNAAEKATYRSFIQADTGIPP